jgi:hypothetical protein
VTINSILAYGRRWGESRHEGLGFLMKKLKPER